MRRGALSLQRNAMEFAVHLTVLDECSAVTAFTAQDHAAVAIFHRAIAHDDVFRRHVDAIIVAAGLDRDAIVAASNKQFRSTSATRVAAVVIRRGKFAHRTVTLLQSTG
jgi:hypothetical protein